MVRRKIPPHAETMFELYRVRDLLRLFANHKEACNCFICRTLSDKQRATLAELQETEWWRTGEVWK